MVADRRSPAPFAQACPLQHPGRSAKPNPVTRAERTLPKFCHDRRFLPSQALGSPLLAPAHLVNLLLRQKDVQPLRADEIVTTSTLNRAQAIRPGETWRTRISRLNLHDIALTLA